VLTAARSLTDILQLARRHRLSSYDASYLELALRKGLPLATLEPISRKPPEKAVYGRHELTHAPA
jgi:hypothetical protein